MTPRELVKQLETLLIAAKKLTNKNCLICLHFDIVSEDCALAKKRPPANIIVTGCESFNERPPF